MLDQPICFEVSAANIPPPPGAEGVVYWGTQVYQGMRPPILLPKKPLWSEI
jgi:hypothetical protein